MVQQHLSLSLTQNMSTSGLQTWGTAKQVTLVRPLITCITHPLGSVLITPDDEGIKDWQVELLTSTHNGDNDDELARIRAEHPDEAECILNRRVLGALAPTRCKCPSSVVISPRSHHSIKPRTCFSYHSLK
jgi:hypothetical protein